jgi:hypothetical protein
MSKVLRKETSQISATKACSSFKTLSTMGVGLHWRNSSPSSGQNRWILTTTDYFTKQIEAIPTRSASHKVIIIFLEDIIARFGCPNKIVTDNVSSFRYEPLVKFCE